MQNYLKILNSKYKNKKKVLSGMWICGLCIQSEVIWDADRFCYFGYEQTPISWCGLTILVDHFAAICKAG